MPDLVEAYNRRNNDGNSYCATHAPVVERIGSGSVRSTDKKRPGKSARYLPQNTPNSAQRSPVRRRGKGRRAAQGRKATQPMRFCRQTAMNARIAAGPRSTPYPVHRLRRKDWLSARRKHWCRGQARRARVTQPPYRQWTIQGSSW
jgi:hypothetical protein